MKNNRNGIILSGDEIGLTYITKYHAMENIHRRIRQWQTIRTKSIWKTLNR